MWCQIRVWRALDRRLWHATGPDRFEGIVRDGEVAITDDRYRGSLCRSLDCVALFDFGPTAVDTGQFGNWSGWFGHQQNARAAIWLEIDRLATAPNLIEAGKMRAISHDGNHRKQYIPGVESWTSRPNSSWFPDRSAADRCPRPIPFPVPGGSRRSPPGRG